MIDNLKNGSLIHPLLVNDDVPLLLSDVAKTISDLSPNYGLLLISISINGEYHQYTGDGMGYSTPIFPGTHACYAFACYAIALLVLIGHGFHCKLLYSQRLFAFYRLLPSAPAPNMLVKLTWESSGFSTWTFASSEVGKNLAVLSFQKTSIGRLDLHGCMEKSGWRCVTRVLPGRYLGLKWIASKFDGLVRNTTFNMPV